MKQRNKRRFKQNKKSRNKKFAPPPSRPAPVPKELSPEQIAEQRYYAEAKKALEAKAKAKPPPPIAPMYQKGHISIDFKAKQAVMTLQNAEPKAKAPPPPLDEDESRRITWNLVDNISNAAKAERAAKAAREAQFKAPPQVLLNQKEQGPPNLCLP